MAESSSPENQIPQSKQESQTTEDFGYKRMVAEPHLRKLRENEKVAGVNPHDPTAIKNRHLNAKDRIEIETEGLTDSLTGLLNYNGLRKRLASEAELMKRDQRPRVILAFDANGLKEFNDTRGHEEGNSLLRDVADRIRRNTRIYDPVSRQGGDEFTAILPMTVEESKVFFERLNKSFSEPRTALNGDPLGGISIATGVTPLNPDNPDESLVQADAAMYIAKIRGKQEGRNMLVDSTDLTAEDMAAYQTSKQKG